MIITPLETVGNLRKKMRKFGYASLHGQFIKFSSSFGEGHCYFISSSRNFINFNTPIKVETIYDSLANLKISDITEVAFYELETKGDYFIRGFISFIYYNEDRSKDLLIVSCGNWNFFIDRKDFKHLQLEKGDWIEFEIKTLELYDISWTYYSAALNLIKCY